MLSGNPSFVALVFVGATGIFAGSPSFVALVFVGVVGIPSFVRFVFVVSPSFVALILVLPEVCFLHWFLCRCCCCYPSFVALVFVGVTGIFVVAGILLL